MTPATILELPPIDPVTWIAVSVGIGFVLLAAFIVASTWAGRK